MVTPVSKYQMAVNKGREIEEEVSQLLVSIDTKLNNLQQENPQFQWEEYQIMNFEVKAYKLIAQFNTLLRENMSFDAEPTEVRLTQEQLSTLKAMKEDVENSLYTQMSGLFSRKVNCQTCDKALWQAMRWNRANVPGDAFQSNQEATTRSPMMRVLASQSMEQPSETVNNETQARASYRSRRRLFD